jgi:murein DD-endopeptidase MepM/ murein hydrolase activator NlpD
LRRPCSASRGAERRKRGTASCSRAAGILLCVALFVAAPAWDAGAADPKKVQARLDDVSAQYSKIESELVRTNHRLAQLETDLSRADQVLKDKGEQMRARVGYIYRQASFGSYIEGLLNSEDSDMFIRRLEMLQIVGTRDSEVVDEVQITKARGDELRAELEATQRKQEGLAASLKGKQRELERQLKEAKNVAAGAARISVRGFAFPVIGAVAFADTWGAPRSGGRRHQGTDLMAPCGAPSVAVADGTISGLGSHGRGGIMLWLTARNGDVFFYAHMRGYAPGVRVGKPVRAGEVISYVGNTGNARGGPCHIHFEWHPRGGAPVNPYRILRSAV